VCWGAEGKGKLSEAERQVKRADAARRRKQQVEKAAIEIQVLKFTFVWCQRTVFFMQLTMTFFTSNKHCLQEMTMNH
jgi:hypothetical protein